MKYWEIKKENLVDTLSHPEYRGRADELIRKRIGIVLGGNISPSKFAAALRAGKAETDQIDRIADELIAWIADPRNGKRAEVTDRAGVTMLCMRALEAAANRGIKTA